MPLASANMSLAGWGRYKPVPCTAYRPERSSELNSFLDTPPTSFIARGLGRSYGDAAVNENGALLDMTRLNRMQSFDAATGVLECEGGVSLAEILEVFVPRGFFLSVTPGTKFVTVAGAIANDVHGKNHHCDGTFTQFVDSIELWTPARGVLTCSREENSDIFWATAGGVGLTGIILSATLRLRPVESAYMQVDNKQCSHLDEALEAMAASDKDYLYSVAWVDCLAKGTSLGRSILMRGNHAAANELPAKRMSTPFRLPRRPQLTIPVDFPAFVLNPYSIKAFNTLFYAKNRNADHVVVDYDKYFYPLDGIQQWNRMYGRKGFVQYQATFPLDGRPGLVKMLERLAASGRASFLAVLKCFGESGPGLLSHPIAGYTLTLDIPNNAGLDAFVGALDRLLLEYGGRLYLAKDTLANPETIAKMYPKLNEFREIREQLDPNHIISSSLSRRLRLDGTAGEPS